MVECVVVVVVWGMVVEGAVFDVGGVWVMVGMV